MIRNALIVQKEKYKIPNRKNGQINGEFRKERKITYQPYKNVVSFTSSQRNAN